MENKTDTLDMTADIVSAFVGNNSIPAGELPSLIQSVYQALNSISSGEETKVEAPKEPAVSVKKSISNDYIVCLEDGRKFKSLKRHLRTKYGMSPEEYRAKWNLPKDYPMVAPNYAKARSDLAKQMGLGQGGRQVARKGRAKA
ncbi:MucR family transcriptional regulator [Asticcacaulis solisilvae]|jgi:predicted transcriptional regulator|uniref:MucR family transcriptional regulator n=1 Tax=Asticcacaulis solisilvae TaxID=1217274 RepID=UPI003FD78A3D